MQGSRRRWFAPFGFVLVVSIALVGSPAAADPDYPSADDVAAAKEQADIAASSVAQIETRLNALVTERQDAQDAAEAAAEKYNAAAEELKKAKTEAETATAQARTAAEELRAARAELARIALRAQRTDGPLSSLEPFLSSEGLADSLRRAELIRILGTNSDRAVERAATAATAQKAAQKWAASAVAYRKKTAAKAASARATAQKAVDAAQAAEASARTERTALLTELAERRKTSLALERQRQDGLEAEARKAAEEKARRERLRLEAARAAAEARRVAAAEKEAARKAAAQEARRAAETSDSSGSGDSGSSGSGSSGDSGSSGSGSSGDSGSSGSSDSGSSGSSGSGDSASSGSSGSSSGSSGSTDFADAGSSSGSAATASAGAAALTWARAQIGKPYLWGGSGPNAFDCSGLTSQAYLHTSGKWIQRVAADQYRAAVKVSYQNLRPGDLLFYSSSGTAAGITHVTMYAGNGMMVEAPRTGLNIRETPMRWARLMPYAGRP